MTMRPISTLLLFLPFALTAQETHTVHVGGSTSGGAAPYYAPQHITINTGDIVEWVRDNGTHNVDGRTSTFPANPEGFYSGSPNGTVWPFQYTFTVAGVYNYHCTQNGHSATQFGSITVLGSGTNVEEQGAAEGLQLFPVPTNGDLLVDVGAMVVRKATVFTMDGKQVLEPSVQSGPRLLIAAGELAAGQYVLRLVDDKGNTLTRTFRKE